MAKSILNRGQILSLNCQVTLYNFKFHNRKKDYKIKNFKALKEISYS